MADNRLSSLQSVAGNVFDIQRYSLHDGPGLRTNVFLKGCALSCAWCSNPEALESKPQIAFFERNCFLCKDCLPVCSPGAITLEDQRIAWDPKRCTQCGNCVEVCTARVFSWIGSRMTAGEVITEVLRDLPFYLGNGGLTLTGGEPALQPEFAEALLRLAKAEGLHTTIETCGAVAWGNLERLLPYLDLVLFDLKHIDPQIQQRFTGATNGTILQNLQRTARQCREVIVRIPLIPGFNADCETLANMAEFVRSLQTVREVHLLGYHTLGKAKYAALGMSYAFAEIPPMQPAEVEEWAGIFRNRGFTVQVGG